MVFRSSDGRMERGQIALPDLEPIWEAAVDHDLPIVPHSFTWNPLYFPGYQDLWDNISLGRLASHPWGGDALHGGLQRS
jgi:predicted TIM-barrel fold metal-dependent hydrolase